ncbi:uncharacterized protein LOC132628019 [Lycium barbarum]|uniref:uncharacterized protein LOC132628019 n=1 Tax=Lycium barbarum TaxID=112863 RepID=UPI00293E16CA|nr:uncharacterized protein LOC132628019 [Lycium barbarum]
MELEDSILNFSDEDESFDDEEDVKMNDIEEGELVEKISKTGLEETSAGASASSTNPLPGKKNQRRRKKKKKKNKRKGGSSGSKATDINRFVLDVGKRLKERKSYLIWTAVGLLGVSALSDLVKEVDAIQTCGGQKTADGRRHRTGGGILWSILKVRDPNAYKEIMKKGKEFEKQFKQEAKLKQEPLQNKEASFERSSQTMGDKITANSSDVLLQQVPVEQSNSGAKRAPVHERMRMPVTYDDLFEGIDEGNDSKDPLAPEKNSYDVLG